MHNWRDDTPQRVRTEMTTDYIFVARENELGQLAVFLDRALSGQGQVCFVTGEAGCGKTTLIREFARLAQEQHKDLIVAVGQSDAQTGTGDPYLPFRELLNQLTGGVETKLAQGGITQENAGRLRKLLGFSGQVLVDLGPDLIGIFVPGAGLAARAATFVAEKTGWLDRLEQLTGQSREDELPAGTGIKQSHIFEQYANVLNELAGKQPLLLVLDDLQWADTASIELLFRLGRRIGSSRILLVGTYRPDEVALGRAGERHPLDKVQAEFKRYFGDIWVDLSQAAGQEGQHFVDALLATEPNRLGQGFRQALYHHTDGHPLFTIELLRAMQERGDLVRDEQGRWIEGQILDWEALPARVEGVIEERIGRLEESLHETLTVASVEGEDFTGEVVARVQAMDARRLVQRLSRELQRQHRLVTAQGSQRLASSGQRLSLYRFQHNLFQTYLYNNLEEAERAYLHEDVGNVLEELFGDQVDEITVQLARHFVEAGMAEKARMYLRRAGEQATARYANAEAVTYFSRALDLTQKTEPTERYALLLARERVYGLLGERDAQKRDLASLEELVGALTDVEQQAAERQAEVALRQAAYAEVTGDYSAAIQSAQEVVRLAQTTETGQLEAEGYWQWGGVLLHQGKHEIARTHLEHALTLARSQGVRQVEAGSLSSLGHLNGDLGNWDEAQSCLGQALDIYRQIGDRPGESKSLNRLAIISAQQGEWDAAKSHFEQALRIQRQIGERRGEGIVLNNLGNIARYQNDHVNAMDYYGKCLGIHREVDDRRGECMALCNLGAISLSVGDYAEAKIHLEKSLSVSREIGQRYAEGQGLAYLGILYHHLGDDELACEHGQHALQVAQEISDRHTQGIAWTNLGHSQMGLGRTAEATAAYQKALTLRRELGQHNVAMEALAGLAQVSLNRNDLSQAQVWIEEILAHLDTNTLIGAEEPFRVYLTCYRVLKTNQDPRAQDVLNTAHRLLQDQAAKIDDDELRRSFLENVNAHREITEAWESDALGSAIIRPFSSRP
jgi:adenylate cyclase